MQTGQRVWICELSTVASSFLLAGALTAAQYFDRETSTEHEIRELAQQLYDQANWQGVLNLGPALTHVWKPESGFRPYQ